MGGGRFRAAKTVFRDLWFNKKGKKNEILLFCCTQISYGQNHYVSREKGEKVAQ